VNSTDTQKAASDDAITRGLTNVGAVESFRVPENWQLGRHEERAYGYIYTWHPKGQPQVSLNIRYHGRPLPEADAGILQALLSSGGRILLRQELHALRSVLRDKGDTETFVVGSASIKSIGDVPVLAVSGRYKDQAVDAHTIFVNASGDGHIVQEVSYIAPRDLFTTFQSDAERAFSSLRIR
jgi:hypothetical protein